MTEYKTDEQAREITCQEVAEWTSAYLDAHVSENRNVQITLHLASCAGCEVYIKQIATVRDAVRLLPKADEQPFDSLRLRQAFVAQGRRIPPAG